MVKAFSRGRRTFYAKKNHGLVMIHANNDGTYNTTARLKSGKQTMIHKHSSRKMAVGYVQGFLAI